MAHPHHHHPVPAPKSGPGLSLLRLSAGRRLFGAGVLLVALWAAVFWAVA